MTIVCVVAIALTVAAQQAAVDDFSVSAFLRELQRDVARDDRAAVATRMQYPLTVFAGGVRIPVRDAASLLQSYDVIFTPALKNAIGVETLNIERVNGELRITRITVPIGVAKPERPAEGAPDSGRGGRAGGRAPRRLVLDVGQIQRAGALARGEQDAYLFSARKNQLLEVRINGVTGRDIVAKIGAVKGRAPIDSRARDGVRTWIGRIPDDGEYLIDVVRLAAGDARQLAYVIVIGLR